MHTLEWFSRSIRRSTTKAGLGRFWDIITPAYESMLKLIFKRGLKRNINNTDVVFISHKLRYYTEIYEPQAWKWVMRQVRPGDVIADVGAHFGLYAIALAKRVGKTGKVFAFEPDPHNIAFLKENVALNRIGSELEIIESAVGDTKTILRYHTRDSSISSVVCRLEQESTKDIIEVPCNTLDEILANKKLDVLKIDVEGYEAHVLIGAKNLLARKNGYARAILIEAHPYAWKDYGTESNTIVSLLRESGYKVRSVDGWEVNAIDVYEHLTATKE